MTRPNEAMRAAGAEVAAAFAAGFAAPLPLFADIEQVPYIDPYPERTAADDRCGWTHCNSCCGPCPVCGLEGADYGDPDR